MLETWLDSTFLQVGPVGQWHGWASGVELEIGPMGHTEGHLANLWLPNTRHGQEEGRAKLFPVMAHDSTQGNGHKQKCMMLHLHLKLSSYYEGGWTLEEFLCMGRDTQCPAGHSPLSLLELALLQLQSWAGWSPETPFSIHSVLLWLCPFICLPPATPLPVDLNIFFICF